MAFSLVPNSFFNLPLLMTIQGAPGTGLLLDKSTSRPGLKSGQQMQKSHQRET